MDRDPAAKDVFCERVNNYTDYLEHPHVKESGAIDWIEQDGVGRMPVANIPGLPPAAEHAPQQREAFGRDRTATAPCARAANRAALEEVERDQLALGPAGPGIGLGAVATRIRRLAAPRARVEHGVESLEREQLPEEGGRDERIARDAERAQRAREHPVHRRVGFTVLGHLVDRFEHRDGVGQERVLLAQCPVRVERLGLGHDVELAALVALEGNAAHRLEPGTELARGLADPLGDRADLAVALGEDRDDPVGLTELDRTKHNPLVAIKTRHYNSVSQAQIRNCAC